MMNQVGVIVCAVLFASAQGSSAPEEDAFDIFTSVRELGAARGLDIGGGLTVHLDSVNSPANASLLERHALRFEFNGVGLRVGKADDREAFKIGLYYDEGRGKKGKLSELVLPALLGYKATTMAVFGMALVSMLVMKSLIIAKMAIASAAAIFATKYFSKKAETKTSEHLEGIELDHHPSELHPMYADYQGDVKDMLTAYGATGAATGEGQYLAYSAQAQDSAGLIPQSSAGSPQYAYIDIPGNNSAGAIQIVERREGGSLDNNNNKNNSIGARKKAAIPVKTYITIKRKTTVTN